MLVGYLAGFPLASGDPGSPPASEVLTVSECLADFCPADPDAFTAPWHDSLASAQAAAASAPGAQVLAVIQNPAETQPRPG